MRWVIVQPGPSWSVHDVFVGWVEALRQLGEDVHPYNLDDRLALYDSALIEVGKQDDGNLRLRKALTVEQAMELAVNGLPAMLWKTRPDVLVLICGFFIPTDLLDHARRTGTRVVIIHTEEPYEVERELALAAHADLNLINDPTHLARFQDVAPTIWAPHAYRPAVHHPGPGVAELAADLAFVGTGFPSRRWFFEQLALGGHLDGLDVLLGGNWNGVVEGSILWPLLGSGDPEECVDNEQTADIYRSTRVGLNLYRREHDAGSSAAGLAMGPREVEMAACGQFFLRDPRPEGDELFPMLPTFADPGDAGEKLAWWLANDDARRVAAGQAYAAIADRTFTASATKLLRLFDRQPVTT